MSWASRRRFAYLSVIFGVIAVIVGIPLAMWLYRPATCFDGIQNQGETAVDMSGPCTLLDPRTLTAHAILWARAFPTRDGMHNAIAYVENPNDDAGVFLTPYRFRLYDERNVLVAEREGATFVMPGTITPVFEGAINTGNRTVARAYFEFMAPLVWERMTDSTALIAVLSKDMQDAATRPRLTAVVHNTSVADLRDVVFVAVVFDTAGNAFAGSSTIVPMLSDGEKKEIVFTWPDAFEYLPGRIDVIPVLAPTGNQ